MKVKKIYKCDDCDKILEKDEVALNKKYRGRNTKSFLCLECMSELLECSVEDLEYQIEKLKEDGCTLF